MFTMPKKFTSNCRRELDRARDAEARVVDENVNAPLAVQDLRHGGVHLRFVRHICLQVHHARLRVFGAAAELIHFQAAAAQGARGVQADARTAAGDDGYTCFGGGCHGVFFEFFKYSIKPVEKLQGTTCELFLTSVTVRPRAH